MQEGKGPESNKAGLESGMVNEKKSEIIETEQYYELTKKCKNSDCEKEFTTKIPKSKVKKGEAEIIFAKTDECGACQNKGAIAAAAEQMRNQREEKAKKEEQP